MNFAERAVHYWKLAEEKEVLAAQGAKELKERYGSDVGSHRVINNAIGMQQHYLRKAHAAAAIALALGHTLDMNQGI